MSAKRPSPELEALRNLVEAVERVLSDKGFGALFVLAHVHGMPYSGPQFNVELNAAKELLADFEGEKG